MDLPIIDVRDADEALVDYYFDLFGLLILDHALTSDELARMNQWVDDHWSHVRALEEQDTDHAAGAWIGHIHTHHYQSDDGLNFQNIIEAEEVFESLIDHPSWIGRIRKYINAGLNGLSIHENFLTVRGPGGFIGMHSGGHVPLTYMTFRHPQTGQWMVGQINVLIPLHDIGPGDGPTTVIPCSHKISEIHPYLATEATAQSYDVKRPAGESAGMVQVYLKAGQVLFFTDCLSHGSARRTNAGYRRTVVYRYSPQWVRDRFNYATSQALLDRLTTSRRQIIEPIPPRKPQES